MAPLLESLRSAWPPEGWRDVSALVAVSGGADSVALLCALAAIKREAGGKGRLVVGHFNHGWRGAESDGDARFVAELAARLGLECRVGHSPATLARSASEGSAHVSTSHGDSREGRARDERYAFLQRTAEEAGARYVVTAHTADDQAETILHHILRGTGLSGLAGMARARELGPAVTLLRPLLSIRRVELLAYLGEIGQDYRTDATNADPAFTRSRIRHDLLPHIEETIQPRAVEAICRLGQLAGEAQQVMQGVVTKLLAEHATLAPGRATLDCSALATQPPYLIRELLLALWRQQVWPLQEMTLARWEELADMVRAPAPPAAQVYPGGLRAAREGERLTISKTT